MTLLIEDEKTLEALQQIADIRKVSLDEAVRVAAKETLQRERRNLPVEERMAKIWAVVRSAPDTNVVLDKRFYDELNGEDEFRGKAE